MWRDLVKLIPVIKNFHKVKRVSITESHHKVTGVFMLQGCLKVKNLPIVKGLKLAPLVQNGHSLTATPSMNKDLNLSPLVKKEYQTQIRNVSHHKGRKSPPSSSILSSFVPDQQKQKYQEGFGEKPSESSWRTMKYTILAFGISFSCVGGYILFELGKPSVDIRGTEIQDEFSHLPGYKQYFLRALRELDYYSRMIKEPSREKLLPDPVQHPYYQPPYTLILEMTDVLVHPDWTYQTGWRFKKRPGIDHFLDTLNGLFEIVIFTAEQGITVFPIIEALDPNNAISHKLVRDATHFVDGHHVKDLTKLNRDLSKVIVVDWNVDSVKFHPENLLQVGRWVGNDDDSTLIDLAAFLRTVAQSDVDDVRGVLQYYKQFDDPLGTFRERQKQLMEQQESEKQSENNSVPIVKRWAPTLLSRSF